MNIPLFALGWLAIGRPAILLVQSGGNGRIISGLDAADSKISHSRQHPRRSIRRDSNRHRIGPDTSLERIGRWPGHSVSYDFETLFNPPWFHHPGLQHLPTFFCCLPFFLEIALYALVFMYVTSQILNLVVTGLNQRKAVMIISTHWAEINRQIISKLLRGVTVVTGKGGYSGKETQIIYTVITLQELARLKGIIREIDPSAFVVITETLEVMGYRIGNQPHW